MTFINRPEVLPHLLERSKRDIDAVNEYMDKLKGTVISCEWIRSGQAGPYQDSVTEIRIFGHQPNSLTTNAPMVRTFTRADILILARLFLGDFKEKPEFLSTHLEYLEPEGNPCGLEQYTNNHPTLLPRHSCWRIRVRTPWND